MDALTCLKTRRSIRAYEDRQVDEALLAQVLEVLTGERALGDLPLGAYESYVEEASALHPELGALSDLTKQRLRNQLFQMLREVGFIDAHGTLQSYLLPYGMEKQLPADERGFFPTANLAG